jgi:hypothetical protein
MPQSQQALLSVILATAVVLPAAQAFNAEEPEYWLTGASSGLPPYVIETLALIEKPERRLLAVRSYLRAGTRLAHRWSWSQERISAYSLTPEGTAAASDIDAVLNAFAGSNPGYALRVNREIRSLDVQISRWNQNASVGEVASALVTSMRQQFSTYGTEAAPATLQKALMDWKPEVEASLVAPGLSAHGQARARHRTERAARVQRLLTSPA